MQSLKNARALANALRVDQPQSGLDNTQQQINPQIIIQQSEMDEARAIESSTISETPGSKDPVTEELKRLDADVKHGLLDKTGDGANANIIKLGEELKKVAEGIKNISAGSGKITAREIQYDDERLSAIRMQAERYIPGMRETLGGGERGIFGGLKDIFSSSPMKDFKLEDIDERSLFGGVIKRRMAERQYAEDQLSMIKTTKGSIQEDIQKQARYQDEQGQFSEKLFRQRKIEQFRQQNAIRGEISKTMEEIDRLKHDEGYTDEQIKKTGLYKTLHKQESRLSLVDPERFGKEVRAAKRKDYEQQLATRTGSIAPKNISSVSPTSPISDTLEKSSVNISEKESEQMLVVSQQIGLLKQIEENTRHLKDLGSILKSAMDKIGTAGGSDSGGGDGGGIDLGGLGDLGNGPDRRRGSRGRGIGSKLKRLGRGAIELGAKGARAALPYALPAAIAYGAARTLDYGASALGVGDVEIDETEDEANWQKMSAGQKIGSGIARGIESVGSFLGLESFAKEAEASRIEKETKMLQGQTRSSSASEQTIETNIKFNEPSIDNYKVDQQKTDVAYKEKLLAQSELESFVAQEGEMQLLSSNEWGDAYGYTDPEKQKKLIELRRNVTSKEQEIDDIVDAPKKRFIAEYIAKNKHKFKYREESLERFAESAWARRQSTEAIVEGKAIIDGNIATTKVYGGEILGNELTAGQMNRLDRMLDLDPKSIDPEMLQKHQRQKQKILAQSIEPAQDLGGKVYQESDELKAAEKSSIQQQSQPAANIINAPTTNVNQTTNNVTRPSARNTDSTYREYAKSRFSW